MRPRWLFPEPFQLRTALPLAAGFAVAHVLSLLLIRYGGPLAPAWPPVGIGLAALLLLPASHRALVYVGYAVIDTLSNAAQGYATTSGFGYLAVSLSELFLAEWLLRRISPEWPLRFARVRDASALLVSTTVAALVCAPIAAVVARIGTGASWIESAVLWWVGDMLAYLVFTPLTVLVLESPRTPHRQPSSVWWYAEAMLVAAIVTVGAIWGFTERHIAGDVVAHPYMLTLPLLWATLRFGQIGALLAVFQVGVVGLTLLLTDHPLLLDAPTRSAALTALQVFLGVTAIAALVLATALREQEDTARSNAQIVTALRASEQRLRQSQKMEAIGQLAGGVAHDFNNVLAAIMMQLDELRLVREMPRVGRELITDVESSVQRAARLTRQLLVFSRQQAMQPQLLDLNTLVRNHVRLLRRVVPSTHTLVVTCAPAPLVVSADGGMIEQVLLNLVLNARDAQASGGPVAIATAERLQSADAQDLAAGRYAVLSVRDQGDGIAAEHLPRLFEPFFTTKAPGQGTGLGLATAYGIVQQHAGTIRAISGVGLGTTMEVWVPISEVPLPEAEGAADQLDQDTGEHVAAATVLVVEDEATVRRLMQRVLEREGYIVHMAASGREALDSWSRIGHAVDLVVTDLVMPGGVSGTQLARELRRLSPTLPIIYTSGYDPEYDPSDVTMVPGENFIAKPASAEQILSIVRRQLAERTQ